MMCCLVQNVLLTLQKLWNTKDDMEYKDDLGSLARFRQ